ncbi:enoyl-CoA hydratase/isomerase family protein [Pseudorhodobacter sp.]|uniref:enoyl-CoA hydratase/isomerase family protein n=1 Tax=Pseudorhodobacter sp. TaxID=1934400 RepID=UPI002647A8A6|nr:enoyl-CoA hydratase/isomerase family protein [Pseudorhodobacter sp.]MDN5788397.1 enoyl-CoA hydratase/isomerase family protein [Pseudorhodobacter sp.]
MSDIAIRVEGHVGRITLTRPQALNALTYQMCLAIDAALLRWCDDVRVDLVMIDAQGDRAFSSGGDIAEMYATGRAGDFDYGRRFWADEYRMNARLKEFPKPTLSFLQGFTMGGGVGVGCHAGLRIVGETAQIAMPECGIGLIPDVGGSMILARAPGALGEYLGLTGARMGPADAIWAGFADVFVPEAEWESLKARIIAEGSLDVVRGVAPPSGGLQALTPQIDAHFSAGNLGDLMSSLHEDASGFAAATLKLLSRNAPLSMACTLAVLAELGDAPDICQALAMEYRFTWRAMEHADFLEGIRAAIIDRDRKPRWRHAIAAVPAQEVSRMLAPLGPNALVF